MLNQDQDRLSTDLFLVDTRPLPAERNSPVLGAVHINANDLSKLIKAAGDHAAVGLIGDSQYPSKLTALRLHNAGYTNVRAVIDYCGTALAHGAGFESKQQARRVWLLRTGAMLTLAIGLWVYGFGLATAPIAAIGFAAAASWSRPVSYETQLPVREHGRAPHA